MEHAYYMHSILTREFNLNYRYLSINARDLNVRISEEGDEVDATFQ